MADVFVSYKTEDRERVKLVADGLAAEGFTVWWDPELRAGDTYDAVIERNLHEARAVVVLWTPRSVVSDWVRSEATVAQQRRVLVPAFLEPCALPVVFTLVQAADLSHWWGQRDDPQWVRFVHDVRVKVAAGPSDVPPVPRPPPPVAPGPDPRRLVRTVVVVGVLGAAIPAAFQLGIGFLIRSSTPAVPVEPAAAPATEQPSSATGTLTVHANRRALVYVDDLAITYTPLTHPLAPGRHTVSAILPGQPNSRQTREIQVLEGDTVRIEFTF